MFTKRAEDCAQPQSPGSFASGSTGNDDAWIIVRPVDGCVPTDMVTAVVRAPTQVVDELLSGIGRGGRIVLIGLARVGDNSIARLRMTHVHSINGVPLRSS